MGDTFTVEIFPRKRRKTAFPWEYLYSERISQLALSAVAPVAFALMLTFARGCLGARGRLLADAHVRPPGTIPSVVIHSWVGGWDPAGLYVAVLGSAGLSPWLPRLPPTSPGTPHMGGTWNRTPTAPAPVVTFHSRMQ